MGKYDIRDSFVQIIEQGSGFQDGRDHRGEIGQWGRPGRLHQLRAPVSDFTGRESELTDLLSHLRGDKATALITGIRAMGGVGKTELALKVAHELPLAGFH